MSSEIDWNELEYELELMKEEEAKEMARRVAEGKPPKPPEPFVSKALSKVLQDRTKYLKDAVVHYAYLVSKSGRVLPFPADELLQKHEMDLLLLGKSTGYWATMEPSGITMAMQYISKATAHTEYEDPADVAAELVRNLYTVIEIMSFPCDDFDTQEEERASNAEYARMKEDPEYMEQKLAEAIAHYESVKHLY